MESDIIEIIQNILLDKDTDVWHYGDFGKLAPTIVDELDNLGLINYEGDVPCS